MMLMFGSNIQSPADKLSKVQEDYLYHSLVNPKPQIKSALEQIRIVYTLDKARYSMLKRQLPYIVCGSFNPPFRRKENFAFTEHFMLDLDHLSARGKDIDELREQICKDSRVLLCFASPSLDGLKVLFKLKDRCYDGGAYSLFYKAFARQFSSQMGLDQVVDSKTSDVTRACFISTDPKAFYNPEADPVDLSSIVNIENPLGGFDLKHEQKREDKIAGKSQPSDTISKDPDKIAMEQIRAKLRPDARQAKREAYVPEQLNDIIDALKSYIADTGIVVREVINIQYAKKIRAQLGLRQAEVNLFYGKRGYSIVVSPRLGTDDELNRLLADVIRSFISDQSKLPY